MTTDTLPKGASRRVELSGVPVTLTGIAKGAGMIHPDMATLLVFMATDAAVSAPVLRRLLTGAVAGSFNCISVDGDTSTNDAAVLLATGRSGASVDRDPEPFAAALNGLAAELAEAVVRDGEGATKFIVVRVEEGATREECLAVARAVAGSPLVKTAFFASDPNWGRILAAIGRAGLPALDIGRVQVWLDDVAIVENGQRAGAYTEEAGRRVMAQKDITVRIRLGRGDAAERLMTCDFSYDYVRINAEYRT
jgi:glutamate N-acetyltransferase/amino-acid N-acetyltransferase